MVERRWRRFLKNRLAVAGVVILFLLYSLAILAGFFSPYDPNFYSLNPPVSYAPPTQVHWRDPEGGFSRPYVYAMTRSRDPETFALVYTEDPTQGKFYLDFFHRTPESPYRILGVFHSTLRGVGVAEPARLHLLGTDSLGRDLWSRIAFGAQVSLTIGILASLVAFVIGSALGGIAGYYGGIWDSLIMRLVEILAAIPGLFLLISLRAVFPLTLDPLFIFYLVVFILALVGWGGIARVIRGLILSLREQDYIQAARALGASDGRIIGRHLLPATASYLIVSLSLAIPGYILAESGLSFLGLGVTEPYTSWGMLLRSAQEGGFASFSSRPWILVPGVFIFLAILAWNFVGDGLRDAFNPRGSAG